jgi:hypothetical protein
MPAASVAGSSPLRANAKDNRAFVEGLLAVGPRRLRAGGAFALGVELRAASASF